MKISLKQKLLDKINYQGECSLESLDYMGYNELGYKHATVLRRLQELAQIGSIKPIHSQKGIVNGYKVSSVVNLIKTSPSSNYSPTRSPRGMFGDMDVYKELDKLTIIRKTNIRD
jgi:hypothetical protein